MQALMSDWAALAVDLGEATRKVGEGASDKRTAEGADKSAG